MDFSEEREDLLLLVMVVLLLLLSAVIWIAFCIAVKKTAMKFFELKRQRRREYDNTRAALPSYEEAVSMSSTPSPNTVLPPTQSYQNRVLTHNDVSLQNVFAFRAPPYKEVAPKNERVLRIAPDRPGSQGAMVLPPSYDSATQQCPTPEAPRRTSSIYTLSSALANTSI
ncbi:unnamed protein product [Heligmosomoides polygyrus]|uniref:Uncharacterized protein n=1 Tax=Heligmosomoides polygyrus TaxID=6339 RepID=A0A183GHF6_HELPZ|nr:unnamed protein product [Heligmosomoides polygyrus]